MGMSGRGGMGNSTVAGHLNSLVRGGSENDSSLSEEDSVSDSDDGTVSSIRTDGGGPRGRMKVGSSDSVGGCDRGCGCGCGRDRGGDGFRFGSCSKNGRQKAQTTAVIVQNRSIAFISKAGDERFQG